LSQLDGFVNTYTSDSSVALDGLHECKRVVGTPIYKPSAYNNIHKEEG